ncbi:MAG TPA: glycosyltransferase [Elusimicrobiota bacterium]|nr:glycosyltransferase [Elusimicrobiota bacterium]
MARKLVTIGIPVYNGERFLEETLRSILNQSYADLEILVSDNASTDRTPDIIRKFSDPRIVCRRANATIPGEENWNLLLKIARGDYVAVFHADDVYSSRIVEEEVRFLENHPEAGAVLTLMEFIDEAGRIRGRTSLPKTLAPNAPLNFSEVFHALMRHGNSFLGCPTAMARRSAYAAAGPFDYKNLGTSADLGMWLKFLERGSIGVLSERLVKYRVHATSGGSRYQAARTEPADFFKVMDKFENSPALKNPPDDAARRQHAFHRQRDCLRRAVNLLAQNRIAEAKALLSEPWPARPLQACLENRTVAKGLAAAAVIGAAVRLGLGGPAGRMLHRFTHGTR